MTRPAAVADAGRDGVVMKTMMALMLLIASLLMTAPTASACSVFEDPTGVTPTCVDEYEDGYGDETCESVGGHAEGTTATTSVANVVSVHVDNSEYCFNDGFGDPWQGSSTSVLVTLDGIGFVTITQSEKTQSGFYDSSGIDADVFVDGVGGTNAGYSRWDGGFGELCTFYVDAGEPVELTIPC